MEIHLINPENDTIMQQTASEILNTLQTWQPPISDVDNYPPSGTVVKKAAQLNNIDS